MYIVSISMRKLSCVCVYVYIYGETTVIAVVLRAMRKSCSYSFSSLNLAESALFSLLEDKFIDKAIYTDKPLVFNFSMRM